MRFTAATVLLAAAACAMPASAGERTVAVTIEHSRFDPGSYSFEEGDRVTFVITNNDPIDHEFLLGGRSVQRKHERGTHARHGDVPGEVSIPAGTTRSTTYTFTDVGTLTIGCHLPAHFDYGMRAVVTVAP